MRHLTALNPNHQINQDEHSTSPNYCSCIQAYEIDTLKIITVSNQP